jgi:phage terminase large subunit
MSKVAVEALKRWREHPDIFVREVFKVTPDPWQDDVLKAFPHNQRLAMKACKGPGKAQPVSLQFYTPDGLRKWGDLKPGDMVFAEDGTPTRIRGVYDRGVLPMFRVVFDDGSFTVVCGEHLWKVKGRTERRHNHWTVIDTNEIIRRGVREKNGRWAGRHFEIPQQGAAQFMCANLPVDPYLFGIWLGDGTRKGFTYTSADPQITDEIRNRGYDVKVQTWAGSGAASTVSVYGQSDNLRSTGVIDLGSHERYIPEIYKISAVNQRIDLLRGLMDSDGNIGTDSHTEFSTTSRRMADDIIWLVRSLGGVAIEKKVKRGRYRNDNNDIVECRDCYRVTVTTPFCPFLLERKKERWHKPQQRYLTRYIDRIEPLPAEPALCIEVEHPSSCYLTNDFIVTHNTAILAWLAWNFLLTRPSPKIAATSITADNLADNLWAELSKWQQKSELLTKMFTWTKTRIFANEAPQTWFMSARSWSKSATPEEQGNALAGLHADYIMFLLDESGGIPEAVMAAAEAALSSCKEGHLVQAGNPTHLEGPLYRACTTERRLWHITEITADPDDPKRTPRVSVQWAREQIEKYGKDNPYVLINVYGRFPPSSINALIGPDEVKEAMKRYYRPQDYSQSARVIGVDVAREGLDSTVIFCRQGLTAFPPVQHRNIDGTQGAGIIARKWQEWDADGVFVDNTGGFGSSWIDNLNRLGFAPIGVHFSSKANDRQYFNKRTEMACECVNWVRKGGALPDVPELLADMVNTTYTFKGDKMIVEPKEVIKEKLGRSPDWFDSLMLTFAEPLVRKGLNHNTGQGGHVFEYNPLSRQHIIPATQPQSQHRIDYNPFAR